MTTDCSKVEYQRPDLAPWALGGEAFPEVLTGPNATATGFDVLCDMDGEILYQIQTRMPR